jgi:hypothetical protein
MLRRMAEPPPVQLSKSRYVAGLRCPRLLWLGFHRPAFAAAPDAARLASIDAGREVGKAAHALFPGGVLVDEPDPRHEAAEARTRALLADPQVPAIFEAAFRYAGVRIRVDVIERLADGRVGLREVKASTAVKPEHVPDLALQKFVLRGCGLDVTSSELIYVDKRFARGDGPIDWSRFFRREDLGRDVDAILPGVERRLAEMHAVLAQSEEPGYEPDRRYLEPHDCEFWSYCTADRSPEWHLSIKRVSGELRARWVEALRTGQTWVSPQLGRALGVFEAPVWYLDFETIGPAIPLFPGTRPYQAVPVQWSLHRLTRDGSLVHREYLAHAGADPRPELARSLIDALRDDDAPIVVWSSYEDRLLRGLADHLPQLAIALADVRGRLLDLLPLVREHVYHPDFAGSFSLKSVAPALAPGFGWADLEAAADGMAASLALLRLQRGQVEAEQEPGLRRELLAYCRRDTEALTRVHQALRDLADGAAL